MAPDALTLVVSPTTTTGTGVFVIEGLHLGVGHIVFDPIKHPHGWHGHWAKTYAPHELHKASPGDVVMAKSGKVFQIEKHTPKGTKVKTIKKDTGELAGGYTVLPHAQQVKTLSKGQHLGSEHLIGDLPEGTHVTTAKGKKFKISKHGKWTTVHPVDSKGEVKGKHTVLPKSTKVTIHQPDESAPMTEQLVDEVAHTVNTGHEKMTIKQMAVGTVFDSASGKKYKKIGDDKVMSLDTGIESWVGTDHEYEVLQKPDVTEAPPEHGPQPIDKQAIIAHDVAQKYLMDYGPSSMAAQVHEAAAAEFHKSGDTTWDQAYYNALQHLDAPVAANDIQEAIDEAIGVTDAHSKLHDPPTLAHEAAQEWMHGAGVSLEDQQAVFGEAQKQYETMHSTSPTLNQNVLWGAAYNAAALKHEVVDASNFSLYNAVSDHIKANAGAPKPEAKPEGIPDAAYEAADKWLGDVYTPEEAAKVHAEALNQFSKSSSISEAGAWGYAYEDALSKVFPTDKNYAELHDVVTAATTTHTYKPLKGDLVEWQGDKSSVYKVIQTSVGTQGSVGIDGPKGYGVVPPSELKLLNHAPPEAPPPESDALAKNIAHATALAWLDKNVPPDKGTAIMQKAQQQMDVVTYPPGWSVAQKWGQAYADAFDYEMGPGKEEVANELWGTVKTAITGGHAPEPETLPVAEKAVALKGAVHTAAQAWLDKYLGPAGSNTKAEVHQEAQDLHDNYGDPWPEAYHQAAMNVLGEDFLAPLEASGTPMIGDAVKTAAGFEALPPTPPVAPDPAQKMMEAAAAHVSEKHNTLTVDQIKDAAKALGYDTSDPGQLTKAVEGAYYKQYQTKPIYKPGLTLKLKAVKQKTESAPTLEGALTAFQDAESANAMAHAAQYAEKNAKKGTEILPTKFKKATPKPYEEGVGKDTQIIIQKADVGQKVVRISPDGNEQVLETFAAGTKKKLRDAARAHAADHEAILEQYIGYKSLVPQEDWKEGDYAVRPNGYRYIVEDFSQMSSGDRLLKLRMLDPSNNPIEGLNARYTMNANTQVLVRFTDKAQLPVGIAAGKQAFQEFQSQSGGTGILSSETLRKAAPQKYSEYLHAGWDPQKLIGQDYKTATAAMKVHGYEEIKPRQKDMVKLINKYGIRLNLGVDHNGAVTSIDQQKLPTIEVEGTAKQFHGQLQETLNTGGDITHLDPRVGPPEQTSSMVKNLVYDMAVGKKKGVSGGEGKVKTDAEYLKELEDEGKTPDVAQFIPEAQKGSSLKIKATASATTLIAGSDDPHMTAEGTYTIDDPTSLTTEEMATVVSMLKRRGTADLVLMRNNHDLVLGAKRLVQDLHEGKLQGATPEGSPFATTGEYVQDNINHWTPAAQQHIDAHKDLIAASAQAMQKQAVQAEIDKRRLKEGTVKQASDDYQLPTWDKVKFQPQSQDDIWDRLVQETHGRDVPAFYTGGLVQDGLLYHRKERSDAKVPLQNDSVVTGRLQQVGAVEGPNSDKKLNNNNGSAPLYAGRSYTLTDAPGKTIEYIYHDQASSQQGGAPTSQRGVLRLTGYAPWEAAARLKELGILGDLEPEVPYESIMRSTRRMGPVVTLHPEYVRGDAPLPKADRLLRHGLSAHTDFNKLVEVMHSGGLKSISERLRAHGSGSGGASWLGDMRSGIDHGLFCSQGGGGVGGAATYTVLLRPSAFLVKDIILSQRDYGPSATRYEDYKRWLNALQEKTGVPKTNIYAPVDPKVRQLQLDGAPGIKTKDFYLAGTQLDAEYNISPAVPVEDWEVISVASTNEQAKLDAILDSMMASGEIKAKPKVVLKGDLAKHQRKVNKT